MDVVRESHDAFNVFNTMAKVLEPKCKRCRREGEKLFLKGDRCYTAKCAIVKRNFPPGLHGAKGRAKLTGYGTQLRAKQKAKRYYGVLEKQFRRYYDIAARKRGETAENLLQILESRADNFVCRACWAKSRAQARQLVSYGHIRVNGKRITIPAYSLKKGDVVEVDLSSQKNAYFESVKPTLEKYEVPVWISMDPKEMKARYLEYPTIEQAAALFDLTSIVEFYSR